MNDLEKQFKIFLEEKLRGRNLDLKRLSEISGIALGNLKNLIEENLVDLPAAPYIRGYLLRLGKILEFDAEEWWNYFRNKKDLKTSGEEDLLPRNRFKTQSVLGYILIGLILILVLSYLIWRFNDILGRPRVELNIPESIMVVQSKKFIVYGKSSGADKILINSEEVFPGPGGEFSKEIMLESGLNTIEIRAQKILGGEIKLIRQIFYKEPENSTQSSNSTSPPLYYPAPL